MGLVMVIVSSVLFGVIPSIQALVLETGCDPLALVVICNGLGCLVPGTMAVARHESLAVGRRELAHLALTGCLGLFLTDYLLDVAYTMIPVGFVTMIHFLYPTLVCAAMAALFGERLTRAKMAAIVLSVVGLALISGADFGGDPRGIVVALVTAVAYAYYMVSCERSPISKVTVLARSSWLNLFVVVCASSAIVARGGVIWPHGPTPWALAAVIGVMLAAAIALLNAGVDAIGAGESALVNMVEPVASLAVSLVVFRYAVSAEALVGCALILCAIALVALGEGRRA